VANKNELLSDVLLVRKAVDIQDDMLKKLKEVKNEAEQKLLEIMELTGEKSFKTEDGINVIRKETLYATPVKEMKAEVMLWVDEECGRPDIVKKSIHGKTFTSFIANRLKERLPVPAELVKSYFKPELIIRGGK